MGSRNDTIKFIESKVLKISALILLTHIYKETNKITLNVNVILLTIMNIYFKINLLKLIFSSNA